MTILVKLNLLQSDLEKTPGENLNQLISTLNTSTEQYKQLISRNKWEETLMNSKNISKTWRSMHRKKSHKCK